MRPSKDRHWKKQERKLWLPDLLLEAMEARDSELILIHLLKEKPYNQESYKSSKLPQK